MLPQAISVILLSDSMLFDQYTSSLLCQSTAATRLASIRTLM